jgi:hypothetical protein
MIAIPIEDGGNHQSNPQSTDAIVSLQSSIGSHVPATRWSLTPDHSRSRVARVSASERTPIGVRANTRRDGPSDVPGRVERTNPLDSSRSSVAYTAPIATSRLVTCSSSRRTFIPYASSPVRTTASMTCSSREPSSTGAGSGRDFIVPSSSRLSQHHGWIREARTPGRHERRQHSDTKQNCDRDRHCERIGRLHAVEQ